MERLWVYFGNPLPKASQEFCFSFWRGDITFLFSRKAVPPLGRIVPWMVRQEGVGRHFPCPSLHAPGVKKKLEKLNGSIDPSSHSFLVACLPKPSVLFFCLQSDMGCRMCVPTSSLCCFYFFPVLLQCVAMDSVSTQVCISHVYVQVPCMHAFMCASERARPSASTVLLCRSEIRSSGHTRLKDGHVAKPLLCFHNGGMQPSCFVQETHTLICIG